MNENQILKEKLNDAYDALKAMGNQIEYLKTDLVDLKKILDITIEFYEKEIDDISKKKQPTRFTIKKRA